MKNFFLFCAALVGVGLVSWATPTHAQAPLSLGLSRSKFFVTAEAGDALRGVITVTNNSEEDVVVTAALKDFRPDGDGGEQTFADTPYSDVRSLRAFTEIGETSFTLAPQATHDFSFILRIPTNTANGGYYGALFFTGAPAHTEQGATLIKTEIGSYILLQIGDKETPMVDVDVKKHPAQFYFNSPKTLKFSFAFTNKGSTHVVPQGVLFLQGPGATVSQDINPDAAVVLPGFTRTLTITPTLSGSLFGRYQVVARFAYATDMIVERTFTFWVVPWWSFAGTGVIIVILLVITARRWRTPLILEGESELGPVGLSIDRQPETPSTGYQPARKVNPLTDPEISKRLEQARFEVLTKAPVQPATPPQKPPVPPAVP